MGEIKSTLDLVMEKTRHLSMSAEEKDRQKRADFEKRLQGLLQQYEDGALSAEALQEKFGVLEAEAGASAPGVLFRAVLGRIDPDQDNDRWLALISRRFSKAADPLKQILAAHQENKDRFWETAVQRLMDRLRQDHDIEGSAVVCNPESDEAYRQNTAKLKDDTKGLIDGISR